ncbi:MAG: acetyl-CoA carboxylase, biotin carboxylase subunit, partial [Acidimicrobiaceae bacterium]|nr:acetyl-CoA carboxylase, biotin carboxylase subunit [Acidimicrobiaceae bacterium]
YYDSLIAKLIVWAPDRAQAVERMDRALSEFKIEGPGLKTTIGFHRKVMANPVFQNGHFATDFIDRHMQM